MGTLMNLLWREARRTVWDHLCSVQLGQAVNVIKSKEKIYWTNLNETRFDFCFKASTLFLLCSAFSSFIRHQTSHSFYLQCVPRIQQRAVASLHIYYSSFVTKMLCRMIRIIYQDLCVSAFFSTENFVWSNKRSLLKSFNTVANIIAVTSSTFLRISVQLDTHNGSQTLDLIGDSLQWLHFPRGEISRKWLSPKEFYKIIKSNWFANRTVIVRKPNLSDSIAKRFSPQVYGIFSSRLEEKVSFAEKGKTEMRNRFLFARSASLKRDNILDISENSHQSHPSVGDSIWVKILSYRLLGDGG